MEFNRYKTIDDASVDAEAWDALASNSETNTIFQTFEWFSCWWETCGEEFELTLIVGKEHGSIRLIAPFMLDKQRFGKRVIRFVGDINSDYCDILARGDKEVLIGQMFDWLLESHIEFDSIELKNVPSQSSTSAILKRITERKNLYSIEERDVLAPTMLIQDHEDFVKKTISKYSVKRPYNKLTRCGHVKYLIPNLDDTNIDTYLKDFFNQHRLRYSEKNIRSLFFSNKYKKFYMSLVKTMSKKRWVHFSILELDDKPIAYHFGFVYNNSFIWYKPSFDISFKEYSPGAVLLRLLIQDALKQHLGEFDFALGSEAYKDRYCNFVKRNENIYIFDSRPKYIFAQQKRQALGLLKKAIGPLLHSIRAHYSHAHK